MREKCILLCIAYPDVSKRYGVLFCMAGITPDGEYRRLYPIPPKTYNKLKVEGFGKRSLIEYNVVRKGDHRKESRRIDPNSIRVLDKIDYIKLRNILEEKNETIEKIEEKRKKDNTSLGIVKPIVEDFVIERDNRREEQIKKYEEQTTIDGGKMKLPIKIIPHYLGYKFRCKDNKRCKGHNIMCEDIEVGMLYWNVFKKYGNDEYIFKKKMKEKLVKWMKEKRDLYFMTGTHYKWGSWLIISILYPPKRKAERLDRFYL